MRLCWMPTFPPGRKVGWAGNRDDGPSKRVHGIQPHALARLVDPGSARSRCEIDPDDLDRARLALALRWLGAEEEWLPPTDHRHDWAAEAQAAGTPSDAFAIVAKTLEIHFFDRSPNPTEVLGQNRPSADPDNLTSGVSLATADPDPASVVPLPACPLGIAG